MGQTLDLGRRIELQPMDKHCQDISVGLYQRDEEGVSQFLVHTYSAVEGGQMRVAFLKQALVVMLGLEVVPDDPDWLRFPCKTTHARALKRAFLDLCKLETNAPLEPKPLTAFDKKANSNLTAKSLGEGVYQMTSEEGAEAGPKRATALTRGFAKLCEMQTPEGGENQVAFDCKTSHDALIGMLMFRAQNVRASMQEEEMESARGVLSSPSQQN